MSQPGAVSRNVLAAIWLVLGLVMVAAPVWLGMTSWPAILSGHPLLLVLVIICAFTGLVAVIWSVASMIIGSRQDREGDSWNPVRRSRAQLVRRARRRIVLATPALIICLLLAATVGYVRPFVATEAALAALAPNEELRINHRLTWYEMVPTKEDKSGVAIKPTTGLIFVPGARVDPRAYAHVLRPLVDAGYLVAVLKEPLGFSILDPYHASAVIDVHPDITYWATGGHSLGGVSASSIADQDERVTGLVLYASYPESRVQREDLKIVSVYGTADGLSTPADIEASRADLPATTQFVVIDGAPHSWFGDYGDQPGDGAAVGDRAAAQAKMADATKALLASLTPPPPPPRPKKK